MFENKILYYVGINFSILKFFRLHDRSITIIKKKNYNGDYIFFRRQIFFTGILKENPIIIIG